LEEPNKIEKESAALNPALSLEHRRYLLYLYARLNKPKMAELLADRILADNPGDKQTLLVLCSLYVERKDAIKALEASNKLISFYPLDHQARYFLAVSHYLAGHYQEANAILRELKLRQFHGKNYPYKTDLASSAMQAGDWYRTMLAYQELLRDPSLGDDLRLQVRKTIEQIYREHLPQLSGETTLSWLKQGLVYATVADYRRHLKDDQSIYFRYDRMDAYVKGSDSVLDRWATRNDAIAGLETTWNYRYSSEISLGGAESGPLAGASLTSRFGPQRWIKFAFQWQNPADDGLLLQSLHGRQNQFSIPFQYAFSRAWLVLGQINGREVTIDGHHLGWSEGANWSVEHIVFAEHPELRIGYRGNFMEFSQNSRDLSLISPAALPGASLASRREMLNGLVKSQLHREGVYGTIRGDESGMFKPFIAAGVDYAFDRSSFEYNAGGGFSCYPRKSIEFRTEAFYTTGANTSDLESDLLQITLALKYWF
jgi:hypothetical protein